MEDQGWLVQMDLNTRAWEQRDRVLAGWQGHLSALSCCLLEWELLSMYRL